MIRLENLTKRFSDVVAVDNVNLTVEDGEILTLLGPSGCGKTTTLRCIAGFVKPDSGDVFFGDRRVTELEPEKRGIGMVFQSYALWPHMTVFDNLAFGLRIRRISSSEIKSRVERTLELVRLGGLAHRFPRQLSGGQQQRIALARALVMEPNVLLLDEPLSNLDAKLREEMRFEIKELQRRLKITTVYVTHDQAEALVLSDRISLMNQGRIVQVSSPRELYDKPRDKFIAGFIGLTAFIEGTVETFEPDKGAAVVVTRDNLRIHVRTKDTKKGQEVSISVRPEHIRLVDAEKMDGTNIFEGQVEQLAYLGSIVDCRIRVGNWTVRAQTETDQAYQVGQKVGVWFNPERITLINR
jgi:iron(III) transport system ATP-binding protein